MVDLQPRRPLADRGAVTTGGITMREASPSAWLVTTRTPVDLPGALALGPLEWLIPDGPHPRTHPALDGTVMLCRDARAGHAFIDLAGEGVFDMLGISALVRQDSGAIVTRLAMLRAIVIWQTTAVRIAVERHSADYLWEWLTDRASLR